MIEFLIIVGFVLLAASLIAFIRHERQRRRALRRRATEPYIAYKSETVMGVVRNPRPPQRTYGSVTGRMSSRHPNYGDTRKRSRHSDDEPINLPPVIVFNEPSRRPDPSPPSYRTGGGDEPTPTFRTGGAILPTTFTTGGDDRSSDYKSSTPSDGGSKSSYDSGGSSGSSGGSSDSGSSGGSSE